MRSLIVILILGVLAWFAADYYQDLKAERNKPQPVKEYVDPAPFEAAEALDGGPMIPDHLRWTLDQRWNRAEEEGEEALKRAIKMYEWHENEGGDPLRFRREKEELVKIFEPIIAGLEEMKLENVGNTGVIGNLQKKIDRFSAAISGVLR
ncbi:MAG: hypothetical protein HQ519_04510 [Planctomycetes bacterium]|nr:hypothetical protein [Planctomycetota bacterium]